MPKARNIVLKVAGAEYPLQSFDTTLILNDIPGKYRYRDIPIELSATYYKPINTLVNAGIGIGETQRISMQRDSTFAIYYGVVTDINGNVIEGAYVKVGNKETSTNKDGVFRVTFDLSEQSYSKQVHIRKQGIGVKDIAAECPDSSQYVLK